MCEYIFLINTIQFFTLICAPNALDAANAGASWRYSFPDLKDTVTVT